ncbi:MAG: putative Ig domain-containing protein [Solirubrobacterales bacterium]
MKRKMMIALLVSVAMMAMPFVALADTAPGTTYSYTSNSDFAQGTLQAVNDTEVADQLQLNKNTLTNKFIWIANANEGTVSKLDTTTGREVARYRTGPSMSTSPSRTAVDKEGNCWVGNRNTGTVVKMAAIPADKNGDGIIRTSQDTNGNGRIDGAELLPWGQDEAIVAETLCDPYTGCLPRSLAIDGQGRIWVGLYNMNRYIVLDSNGTKTGIVVPVPTPQGTYGAAIDSRGYLWSSNLGGNRIDVINTNSPAVIRSIPIGGNTYGIAVDRNGNCWTALYSSTHIVKIDGNTFVPSYYGTNGYMGRGICLDGNGNIWAAFSGNNTIVKMSPAGAQLQVISLGSVGGVTPIGTAADADGFIWAVCQSSNNAFKLNPNTGAILGVYPTGSGPYSYSDMTGFSLQNITTHEGTWSVVKDGGLPNCKWDRISWNAQAPAGTSVTVYARAANQQADLDGAPWISVVNGQINTAIVGQFVEVKATLISNGQQSPVLYDLDLHKASTPPVLNSIGDKTVDEGQGLTFTVTASDQDGDAVALSVYNLPEGAAFDAATGVFSWTPDFTQAGTYPNVRFMATDGTSTVSEAITITVNNVNRAPVINPIGSQTVDENQPLQFAVTASDPDGDAVTLSAANLPEGAVFDAVSGTVYWTPNFFQSGSYPVQFAATDGSLSNNASVTITVNNVNRPPVLEPIADQTVDEAQALQFTAAATDPDAEALTFSASNLPSGAAMSASGVFTWTPGYDQAGNYVITVTVSDGAATDSKTVAITVNNVNRAPELNAIGDKTVDEGQTLQFTVSAVDPDGDAVQLSAANLPNGASFDAATGIFAWSPDYTMAGSYPAIHFEVTDGSLNDVEDITITVIDVNRPPDVTNAAPSIGTLWPPNNKMVAVRINGLTDPDGDALTIVIKSITTDEAVSDGGKKQEPDASGIGSDTASLRAERAGSGNGRVYVISFDCIDAKGAVTTGSVSVSVPHSEGTVAVDDGRLFDAVTGAAL